MGVRESGVVGLGLLVVACGGGRETSTAASGATGRTTGTEQVTISRVEPAPRGEIVEVYESQLPTAVPRIDVASAEGTEGEPTQEEAAPDAMTSPEPALAEATPPAPGTEPASPGAVETEALEVAAKEICPADIETLRVRARNIPSGAAIVLTARSEDDVARLRDRMREFALTHSEEHAQQQCGDPSHAAVTVPTSGGSSARGFADPTSPLLSVHELRLVEIPNGVRVELRYGDDVERASVRELRAQVRDDVAALDDGICPLSFQAAA